MGTLATLLFGFSNELFADMMTGGAAAAVPSPSGINLNPGNLAFVEEGFFDLSPRIVEVNRVLIRYPGFKAIDWDKKGISPLTALSFTPNIGDPKKTKFRFLLNEIVPPLRIPFAIKGIPVLILDQLTTFDVKTNVNIRGALGGAISYRINPRIGIGLSAGYRSASLTNNLRVQGESSDFASLNSSVDLISVVAGLRFIAVPGRLALGIASNLFTSQTLKNNISGDIANAAGDVIDPTVSETTQSIKTVLIGSHLVINAYISMRLDLLYTRANHDDQRFSLVDLENQYVESYDSLGLRVGAKIWTPQGNVVSGGYTYEPSNIGAGQRGTESETGFGIQDYVLVLAGIDELKPYHRFVGAIGRSFGFEKGVAHWNAMIGFAYQIASLGIDENGEQPGAFTQQKYFLPGQITYRF